MNAEKKTRLIRFGIIGLTVYMFFLLIFSLTMYRRIGNLEAALSAKEEIVQAEKQKPQSAPPVSEFKDERAEKFSMATVAEGEGIENPLIRQLIADSKSHGFKGNASDFVKITKWAERTAHIKAVKAGIVDWKFGAEVRVKSAGETAYVLEKDKDGNETIATYTKDKGGKFKDTPDHVRKIAASYSKAVFAGHSGGGGIHPCEQIYEP